MKIDRELCNGCGGLAEGRCMTVCPGDLLFMDESGRCSIREPRDCWDCASCIKECPRQAIEMYLPVQIGGRGATLKARVNMGHVTWILTRPDGTTEKFEITTMNKGEI